jgi:hypothetical protein
MHLCKGMRVSCPCVEGGGSSQSKVSRYLAVHNESISSIKMIDGFASLAISNICFTNFSLSPVGQDRKDRDRIDR